jgi:hypothetical protein
MKLFGTITLDWQRERSRYRVNQRSLSNHAMQLTAGRSEFPLNVTSTIPLQFMLALSQR